MTLNATTVNTMDFGFYTNVLGGFDFGTDLLTIVIIAISAIIITRDTRNIRLLLFPLILGWSRAGLAVPVWLWTVGAIVSVVTLVGAHNIGATLNSVQETVTQTIRDSGSKLGRKWATNRAVQEGATSNAVWSATQGQRTAQMLREDAEADWMDQATEETKFNKALRQDKFGNKLWRATQAGRTARAIKQAEENAWINDATEDTRFDQAIKRDRFGRKLWGATQAGRTQQAIRQAEENLWLAKANRNTNLKKGLFDARFKDELDFRTTPIQVRQQVRSKWTGRQSRDLANELDEMRWRRNYKWKKP